MQDFWYKTHSPTNSNEVSIRWVLLINLSGSCNTEPYRQQRRPGLPKFHRDDDRPAAVDAGGMDQVCYQTVCITNLFIALWFYWPVSSTTVLAQLQISNCGKKNTYKLRLHCGPTVTMMSDCNWRTCLSKNAMLLLFKLIISKESWFFFF